MYTQEYKAYPASLIPNLLGLWVVGLLELGFIGFKHSGLWGPWQFFFGGESR